MRLVTALAIGALVSLAVSACSSASGHATAADTTTRFVAREQPGASIRLVPNLQGGTAGWCLVTRTMTSSGCGEPPTSTGPIFAEECEGSESAATIGVLTASYVAAVSLEGGLPIRTRSTTTLPDGLRGAVIEVRSRDGQPVLRGAQPVCPRLTPLTASGKALGRTGKRGAPLTVYLASARDWNARPEPKSEVCFLPHGEPRNACRLPRMPPRGPCAIALARPTQGMFAHRGIVLTRIELSASVFRPALMSCEDVEYEDEQGDLFDAALLINARNPNATPPSLPAMKPLSDHRGIFQAPSWSGMLLARRIPGAWLVVAEPFLFGRPESSTTGLSLLEALQATISLPTSTPTAG